MQLLSVPVLWAPYVKEERMTEMESQSQGQGRRVKRVTNVDVIRRSKGAGQPGTYELELTLDGTQEFVMLVDEN